MEYLGQERCCLWISSFGNSDCKRGEFDRRVVLYVKQTKLHERILLGIACQDRRIDLYKQACLPFTQACRRQVFLKKSVRKCTLAHDYRQHKKCNKNKRKKLPSSCFHGGVCT